MRINEEPDNTVNNGSKSGETFSYEFSQKPYITDTKKYTECWRRRGNLKK